MSLHGHALREVPPLADIGGAAIGELVAESVVAYGIEAREEAARVVAKTGTAFAISMR